MGTFAGETHHSTYNKSKGAELITRDRRKGEQQSAVGERFYQKGRSFWKKKTQRRLLALPGKLSGGRYTEVTIEPVA